MCARYTLTLGSQSLADVFDVALVHDFAPRWNVAPTQTVPVVVEGPRGVRRIEPMRWGLVPSWADDLSIGNRMINARSETAATKPSFRAAMRSRRCLVPADGFYEWTGPAGDRSPIRIRRRDGGVFAFAGLFEVWTKAPEAVETFTILTTGPNELMRPIHDRMPVVLAPSEWSRWLDPDLKDAAAVAPLLRACPPDGWEAAPVSRWVNDPRHDGPECVAPAGAG